MRNMDFSCNVNPLGPPKSIFKNIDLGRLVSLYPDYFNKTMIDALSSFYSLPTENLAVGNGSTELFFTIPRALDISAGLIVAPSFWEYEQSLRLNGKKVFYFKAHEHNGFDMEQERLRRNISSVSRQNSNLAVYICNPNNPTSTLMQPENILALCDEFSSTKFIIDETYLMFRNDYDDLSLMGKIMGHKNLVVVTSLSKFYTIPGIRIGVCGSDKENIDAISRHQIPYGINTVAQAIVPCLLQDMDFIAESRAFMESERRRVYGLAKEIHYLLPFEPQANFILARIRDKSMTSTDIMDHLKQHDMMIRDGTEFIGLGNRYIRFSINRGEDNDALMTSMKAYNIG